MNSYPDPFAARFRNKPEMQQAMMPDIGNFQGMGQMPYGTPILHGAPAWVWQLPDNDPRKQEALNAWQGSQMGADWQGFERYRLGRVD